MNRILTIPTNYTQEVALKMGSLNPSAFRVQSMFNQGPYGVYEPGIAHCDDKMNIRLSPQMISSLIDQQDPTALALIKDGPNYLSHQEALGVLAHEVSHAMLQHAKKTELFAWESLGCPPELSSLTLKVMLLDPLSIDYRSLPGLCAATFYAKYLIEKKTSETPQIYKKIALEKDPLFSIKHEKEADLFTMKVPEYATGLRDALTKLSATNFTDWKNSRYCDLSDDPAKPGTHPPLADRVDYLNEALRTISTNQKHLALLRK